MPFWPELCRSARWDQGIRQGTSPKGTLHLPKHDIYLSRSQGVIKNNVNMHNEQSQLDTKQSESLTDQSLRPTSPAYPNDPCVHTRQQPTQSSAAHSFHVQHSPGQRHVTQFSCSCRRGAHSGSLVRSA